MCYCQCIVTVLTHLSVVQWPNNKLHNISGNSTVIGSLFLSLPFRFTLFIHSGSRVVINITGVLKFLVSFTCFCELFSPSSSFHLEFIQFYHSFRVWRSNNSRAIVQRYYNVAMSLYGRHYVTREPMEADRQPDRHRSKLKIIEPCFLTIKRFNAIQFDQANDTNDEQIKRY